MTFPSNGILSPGLTIATCPTSTSSTLNVSTLSPTFIWAVSGAISTNDLMERFALCSA